MSTIKPLFVYHSIILILIAIVVTSSTPIPISIPILSKTPSRIPPSFKLRSSGSYPELHRYFTSLEQQKGQLQHQANANPSIRHSDHGPLADPGFVLISQLLPTLNTTVVNDLAIKFTNHIFFPNNKWLSDHLKSKKMASPPLTDPDTSKNPTALPLVEEVAPSMLIDSSPVSPFSSIPSPSLLLNHLNTFALDTVKRLTHYEQVDSTTNQQNALQYKFINLFNINITQLGISDISYHYTPSPVSPSMLITISGIEVKGDGEFEYELEPFPLIRDSGAVHFHANGGEIAIKLQSVFNITAIRSNRHKIFKPNLTSLFALYERDNGKLCSYDIHDTGWDDVVQVPIWGSVLSAAVNHDKHDIDKTDSQLIADGSMDLDANNRRNLQRQRKLSKDEILMNRGRNPETGSIDYYFFKDHKLIDFDCPLSDYVDKRLLDRPFFSQRLPNGEAFTYSDLKRDIALGAIVNDLRLPLHYQSIHVDNDKDGVFEVLRNSTLHSQSAHDITVSSIDEDHSSHQPLSNSPRPLTRPNRHKNSTRSDKPSTFPPFNPDNFKETTFYLKDAKSHPSTLPLNGLEILYYKCVPKSIPNPHLHHSLHTNRFHTSPFTSTSSMDKLNTPISSESDHPQGQNAATVFAAILESLRNPNPSSIPHRYNETLKDTTLTNPNNNDGKVDTEDESVENDFENALISKLCPNSNPTNPLTPILVKEYITSSGSSSTGGAIVWLNGYPYTLEVSTHIPQLTITTSDTWLVHLYNLILKHYNAEIITGLENIVSSTIYDYIEQWLHVGCQQIQRIRENIEKQLKSFLTKFPTTGTSRNPNPSRSFKPPNIEPYLNMNRTRRDLNTNPTAHRSRFFSQP